jgi:methionyl-tRNA formyltransferase
MISRVEVPITDDDTSGTMFVKLSDAGSKLLQAEMPRLIAGETKAVPQDEAEASYARNLTREDEKIDWNRTSREIYNQIRGLVPFSGAFTMWDEQVFKVWAAANPNQWGASETGAKGQAEPGTVLQLNASGIEVQTGDGSLWLTVVQPAGKKAMKAADFGRGGTLKPGTVLR